MALKNVIKQGEQTILFLNRRGYHTVVALPRLPENLLNARIVMSPMTFHLGENCLSCHLCRLSIKPPPRECPSLSRKTVPLNFEEQEPNKLNGLYMPFFPLFVPYESMPIRQSIKEVTKSFCVTLEQAKQMF